LLKTRFFVNLHGPTPPAMMKSLHSGSATLLILLIFYACVRSSEAPRPNILLILADDMGYGDVAGAGNPYLSTPKLDRLAQGGAQFTHFYVSSVCAPTRASLLTGRYHQRSRVRSVTNGYETIDPTEHTIAEYLQPAGYRTAIFGKWHLGEYYPSLPNAQGFDEFLGFRTGHTADYYDPVLEHNGKPKALKGHITEVLTDEALRFMQADRSTPFFCYLAYNAPHTPLQVDSSWWQPYLEKGLQERTARIYGLIEQLDHNIGRIMDQLPEETIVIFMSDNGPISGWRVPQEEMRYNAGLRDQKFTVYDGGIRTQSYWSWAGHWPERQTLSTLAAHIDVLPTLLDILGIEPKEGDKKIDGVSLQGLLSGTESELPERILFQNYDLSTLSNTDPYPGGIARRGPWKMVNGEQLYHLGNDPGETKDLSEQEPGIFRELQTAYRQWWDDILQRHDLRVSPIPLGYPEADSVALKPHHARVSGELVFLGQRGLLGERIGSHPTGVDGDWLSNWRTTTDRATWPVHFIHAGEYEFGISARYSAGEGPIGLTLRIGDQKLSAQLPERPRSEGWAYYSLGQLEVPEGLDALGLSLTEDNPDLDLEIREVVVEIF
jgi:arylsulfatase A